VTFTGTGIPGQTVNSAVVFDFSKYMNRIHELNPEQRWARIEPGIVPDDLSHAANVYGLTFGPDPATHNRNTIGGMIGNNSCGIHSVMAGEPVDNVKELDVLTYDGVRMTVGATSDTEFKYILQQGGRRAEIYSRLRELRDRYAENIRSEFRMIPRRVSGYNLPALLPEQGFNVTRALVRTEGTCVLVLGARVKLVVNPPVRALLVLGYPDVFAAADNVVAPMKFNPIGLEALDGIFIEYMKRKGLHPPELKLMPEGGAWLLIEFGGKDKSEADRPKCWIRRSRCFEIFFSRSANQFVMAFRS
jgi:FAD/FMN-containing dehydrogenase